MVNKFFALLLVMGVAVASGCGDDNPSGGGAQDAALDSGADAHWDGGPGLDAQGDGGQDLDAQPSPDGGTCTSDDDCAALAGPCQTASCDENTGTCQVEAVADETPCDDGEACTKDDVCTNGECAGTPYDCDDGLDCTDDVCNGEGCDHTMQPGFCAIDGACYSDGATNPNNECEVCDSSQPGVWSGKALGTHCTEGDGPCTQGQCDDSGRCSPVNVENFTDCDDGVAETFGDWCYEGRCSGFEQRILPSDSCYDEDKFVAATTASATGIHAVYLTGVAGIFSDCLATAYVETLDAGTAFDGQSLGTMHGSAVALWGDNLTVGQTLFSKVGSTWTSDNTNGTLRKAWNGVSNNWQTRWVGLRMIDVTKFLGVGFRTDGTPLARTCLYLCQSSCDWYCGNNSIDAQSDVFLTDIAVVAGGGVFLGGYRTSTTSNLLPIVDFERNGAQSWRELDQAGQGVGSSIKDFIGVGDHVLGVGPEGMMVWGPAQNFEQVCADTFDGYDLLQALEFEGRLFVLYTKELSGTQGGGRVFGVAHTTADADDCDAWVFHDIMTYLDVGPAGPGNFTGDPDTWDYDYRVFAVDDHEMYLLGSWWDEDSSHRAKSFLRWSIP